MRRLLLVLLFLLLPAQSFAAWAVISSLCNEQPGSGNGDPSFTTGTLDTTGANLLIVYALQYNHDGGSSGTISDSRSNTWNYLTDQASGDHSGRMAYVYAPSVGSGQTFSMNDDFGISNGAICVLALSGSLSTDPIDQQASAGNYAVTTIQAGAITPASNNQIVIAGLGARNIYNAVSINGGFTIANQSTTDGVNPINLAAIAYLVQGAAASANPTWTDDGFENNVAGIASFKPAVTPPAAIARRRSIVLQ